MSHTAEISRSNPSCLLFLIDQSGSMDDPFGAGESKRKKADGVADAVNKLLQNLTIKCARTEGVRDYYYVGVVGYGERVGSAFTGTLSERDLVPISLVAENPSRVEERIKKEDDGAGGIIERKIKFPVWFDPIAQGGTPMCETLGKAKGIIQNWLNQHPNCFPPIVINITDGESTDGEPASEASALRELSSSDGSVLFFNLHLSSSKAAPIEFPDSVEMLPDDYAKLLFKMSSLLPDYMRSFAQEERYRVSEGTRGFAFNADLISLIRFLDIGTKAANLR